MDRWGWFLVLLLTLAACVSEAEPTETPFTIQRIGISPEFEGLISPWLAAYVEETGQANLKLDLFSPQEIIPALEAGRADLGLISGEVPEEWFATPIVREAIAIIVHPGVQLVSLELGDLADIFSGRVKSWDMLTDSADAIQAVIPLPGSMVRERFIEVVMGDASFDPEVLVGGTPDVVLNHVKSEPGAIGILPYWRVEEDVKLIAFSSVTPQKEAVESGAYPLWLDLVAVSPKEPVGHLRDFLLWLQGTYLPSQTAQ